MRSNKKIPWDSFSIGTIFDITYLYLSLERERYLLKLLFVVEALSREREDDAYAQLSSANLSYLQWVLDELEDVND